MVLFYAYKGQAHHKMSFYPLAWPPSRRREMICCFCSLVIKKYLLKFIFQEVWDKSKVIKY